MIHQRRRMRAMRRTRRRARKRSLAYVHLVQRQGRRTTRTSRPRRRPRTRRRRARAQGRQGTQDVMQVMAHQDRSPATSVGRCWSHRISDDVASRTPTIAIGSSSTTWCFNVRKIFSGNILVASCQIIMGAKGSRSGGDGGTLAAPMAGRARAFGARP